MKRRIGRMIGIAVLVWICLLAVTVHAEDNPTADEAVEAEVERIAAEMNSAGVTGEYNQAVWLHDWLTHHASYEKGEDERWRHTPEGVLLRGEGVCESYTTAYELLLTRVGIENMTASGTARSAAGPEAHIWNVVRLDGIWCHIDATWDDPVGDGQEAYFYFGMTDELISRDHSWVEDTPECGDLSNYYPLRNGAVLFHDAEEMAEKLENLIEQYPDNIQLVYIGTDPAFSVGEEFRDWYSSWNWKYGIQGYEGVHGNYYTQIKPSYTDPWTVASNELDTPVTAPGFTLEGPAGQYKLSNYSGNGLVLVFGRYGCMNTKAYLDGFRGQLEGLYSNGVEFLVNAIDVTNVEGCLAMEEWRPGFKYTYGQDDLMWNYLSTAGYDIQEGVTFPCVFMINSSGQIIYYSTGFVNSDNMKSDIARAFALGTEKELPDPEAINPEDYVNGMGRIGNLSGGVMLEGIQAAVNEGYYVYFVTYGGYTDSTMFNNILTEWENNFELYDSLGMIMLADSLTIPDGEKGNYSHVAFLEYVEKDFGELMKSEGYTGGSVSALASYFYAPDGSCLSYRNGSLISLNSCALMITDRVSYDMEIPADLTEIKEAAFVGSRFVNANLTTGSLTRIGALAFAGNGDLHLVWIPGSVTEIDDSAFDNCGSAILICPGNSEACRFAIRKGRHYIDR